MKESLPLMEGFLIFVRNMSDLKKIALIVAGGAGIRMGNTTPKQFLSLSGIPLLHYSLSAFLNAFEDISVILVLPAARLHYVEELTRSFGEKIPLTVTAGGETRFHSVQNGLQWVKEPSVIFVHDGVRPLVSVELIRNCYAQASESGSAVPCVEPRDSLREVSAEGGNKAVDRLQYRLVQTPQTFRSEILLPAFSQVYQPSFTDEATVVEHSGRPVHLIAGEEENIKITRPVDMLMAESILKQRAAARK